MKFNEENKIGEAINARKADNVLPRKLTTASHVQL